MERKKRREEKRGNEVIGVTSDAMEKRHIRRKCDEIEMEEKVSVW